MSSSLLPVFNRMNVAFVRGEGTYLIDDSGKRYLDFGSGVAVTALGHCHPVLVKALQQQAETLWHCSNWYHIPGQEEVARQLTENSVADYVFFGNSGTEAIECAIKIVRQHFIARGSKRYRIVSMKGSFHGRTFAALAASGKDDFPPALQGFDLIPFGDITALEQAITGDTAAVLLEPVQGEGGIIPASLEYLQQVRALCDRHGILMALDEIQTGIGRTGKLFAHEWAGIAPDIITCAKGIGGGFPFGACLATRHAAEGMGYGKHGSTFGGNPLAMAVGKAVLETILTPGFLEQVDSVARYLWQQSLEVVHEFPEVFREVRGAGLMLGLVCVPENTKVADALRAHGLLVIPAGNNVVRLLPPLIISRQDVDTAIAILRKAAATGV